MMRSLNLRYTVVLIVLSVLFPVASQAQLEEPPPVPSDVSGDRRADLSSRRTALIDQLHSLEARIRAHDSRCGRVPGSNRALVEECRSAFIQLRGEIAAYSTRVKAFGLAVAELATKRSRAKPVQVTVNWAKGSKPPADIAEAVKTAINAAAWPPRVKLVLSKTKFIWKAERASALEFFNPALNLPAAYDQAAGALVIKPGFTKRILAAQIDLLTFELGKLIWDRRSVAYQRRFSKEFAGTILAQGLDRLPNSSDVVEKDANSTFSFAYRHFLFDRRKLPRDLIKWWSNDPPHAVLEVSGGDAIRPIRP